MRKTDLLRGIRQLMLLTLLLFSASVSVKAAMPADTPVSINFKSEQVTTVLKEVQKQSGLNFFYSTEVSKEWPRITIRMTKKPARDVVAQIASLIGCEYTIKDNIVTISKQQVSGRERTIKGYVRDADGEPLVGVPVCIGESRVCTVTDADGFYTFPIPTEETVLKFSYVGMNTEYTRIAAGTGTVTRDIVMRSDNRLDDVVVTGYQTISRERSAGSYNILKGEDVAKKAIVSNSIISALEGLTTGLQVNNAPYADKFTIRGITSIDSNRLPLFVVDGVPLELDQVENMVSSNDIQSVTVLKDATAASIWGSQAANGVVVMQTKKGQQATKPRVSYKGSFTFCGKPDYDYYNYMDGQTWMDNAKELLDIYSQVYSYDQVQSGTTGLTKSGSAAVVWPHEHAMYQTKMGIMTQAECENILARLAAQNGREQYEKYFMSNLFFTQHNISVQGGNNKSTYYLSANYKGDQYTDKDWTNRITLNGYQDYQITDWMKWDVTMNVAFGNTRAHVNPFADSEFNFMSNNTYYDLPYNIFRDANGWVDQQPMVLLDKDRQNAEAVSGIDLGFYPVEDFNSSTDRTTNSNIRINTGLTINLLKGLKYEGRFQYTRLNSRREQFRPSETFSVREERAGTFNIGTASYTDPYGLRVPRTGGHYILNNDITSDWTLRNQLSYDASFDEGRHLITALAGTEVRAYKATGYATYLRGYNMQTMEHETYNNSIFRDFYIFDTLLGSYGAGRYSENSQSESCRKYFSLYANAAYTYLERYTLNASLRMDQSNLFGSDPSTQYKPIWSMGIAWRIGKEEWLKNQQWINDLTLRTSYGFAGNSPRPESGGRYDILSTDNNPSFESPGYLVITPANKMLTWEKTRTINFGFDVALLSNRIRLTFDYYDKYTTDLIGNMTLNPTTGWLTTVGNVGKMSNRGVELMLSTHNVRSRVFNWYTILTLSHNSNKIKKIVLLQPINTANDMLQAYYHEGYPLGAMFSYRYAGLDEHGSPKALDKNGEEMSGVNASYDMDKDDLVYSGTYIPKVYGGFTNRLTYKDFELSFMFAYNLGHKMRAPYQQIYGRLSGSLTKEFGNRWKSPGDETLTDIPRYTVTMYDSDYSMNYNFYALSDKNILDASFIKLRDLSLSWNVPSNWCRKLYAENIKLTAQAGNLFVIAFNGKGIDPEAYNLTSGKRQAKFGPSYSVGINIGF
ncbi:MAG: SusC/RagA family TonB-linked outer membrane protein [Prevotella sp.]|nr:SusC/RagA family TonB-linked outer membrane protein [Prevotella sp.]